VLYGPRLDVEFERSSVRVSSVLKLFTATAKRNMSKHNPRIEPLQPELFFSIPEKPCLVNEGAQYKQRPEISTSVSIVLQASMNDKSCRPIQLAIDPSAIKCAMACNNALLKTEESVSVLSIAPIDRSSYAPLDPIDRHSRPR